MANRRVQKVTVTFDDAGTVERIDVQAGLAWTDGAARGEERRTYLFRRSDLASAEAAPVDAFGAAVHRIVAARPMN